MSILRRVRGVAVSAGIWALVFAAVNVARIGVLGRLGRLYPIGPVGVLGVLRRAALNGAWAGIASGVLFGAIIMLAERRRDFAALTGRRFALWGFGAGALWASGAIVAYAVAGVWPLGLPIAVWTAASHGLVGAGIGIATFLLARPRTASLGINEGSGLQDAH